MPKRSRSGVVSRPGARRRADQRERRQLERHDARARALPDGDRQPVVLHRRVEGLLERARQAVDLIDEEHAARLERGQKRRDVSLALERRSGGLHERNLQLGRDDLRERGLAESRRPGEQQVVERLAARAARLDRHRELLAQRLLADELREPARAQRAVELVLGDAGTASGCEPLSWRAVRCSSSPPSAHDAERARRRAPPSSSSALSPSASRSSSSASAGRVAELEQAVARQPPRRPARRRAARGSACAPRRRRRFRRRTFSRSSTMIRSAVRLPMPGTAWKRAASPAARAPISSRGGAAREHRQRDLRPDRLDGEQHQEQVALLLGGEAVQRERVVAHDQVRVQRDLLADGGHVRAASPPRPPRGSRRRAHRITTWSVRRTATSPRSSAITRPPLPLAHRRAPPPAARSWRGRSPPPARRPRGRAAAPRSGRAAS